MQKQWMYSLVLGTFLILLTNACSRSQSQPVKQTSAQEAPAATSAPSEKQATKIAAPDQKKAVTGQTKKAPAKRFELKQESKKKTPVKKKAKEQ